MALIDRLQDDSVETECCQRSSYYYDIERISHRLEMEHTERDSRNRDKDSIVQISLSLYRQGNNCNKMT